MRMMLIVRLPGQLPMKSNVTVDITDRIATITVNDPDWNGSEHIYFIVEDTSRIAGF